ncbi:hypothetical protein AGOR_G00049680 [Albula goreensis]|uniref:Arrestin-like N-terminal domain-containing protein n=1 Tax=Albula goreensis TaxID=1534307 RepID=A0A8T3DU69_9TELE|nr:hypothetical protein AGOR_G00049680 [Albula goreensis]
MRGSVTGEVKVVNQLLKLLYLRELPDSKATIKNLMKMLGEKFLYLTIKHDALNEKSFVSCGDVISGQIVFEISKEIIVKSIALVANGKTTISWHRGTGDNRSNVFAHENYFNIRTEHVKQHDGDDECEIVLPPGKHVYPFSIQLPQGDFPSSFHGSDCTVCYSLQVTITGPEFMFKQYRSEMNFVNHIDANQPQLLVPLEASNSKDLCCLCCASGPTSMKIRLERRRLALPEDRRSISR